MHLFYASVQRSSMLSRAWCSRSTSDFWNTILNIIKAKIIDYVPFELLECHSAKQLFSLQLFLYGPTFLIGCVLCLSQLLSDFFDLQFWLFGFGFA